MVASASVDTPNGFQKSIKELFARIVFLGELAYQFGCIRGAVVFVQVQPEQRIAILQNGFCQGIKRGMLFLDKEYLVVR